MNFPHGRGRSILASLNEFNEQWVTNEQYDEIGPERVVSEFFT